jgi:hypothetical protein
MRYTYLILAAMFLLCLAPMPIGYFNLVRLVAVISFGVMAYKSYVAKKEIFAWTFGILALLFQPFVKITLGRTIWNIIDVIVAIGFILLFLYENNMLKKISKNPQPKNPIDDTPKLDNLEKNEFTFRLSGKLAPKELIYVASEEDAVISDLFEKNPEVIEGWGKMIGFHVIYLPLLMKRLADEKVLKYRAPYLNNAELATAAVGNDFILKHLENPDDRKLIRQGFMRTEDIHRVGGKDQAINRFYPISSTSSESISDQLHRIGKQIVLESSINRGRNFQIDGNRLDDYQKTSLPPFIPKSSESSVSYDEWGACEDLDAPVTPAFDADQHFNSQQLGENTDDLIEEIKERIAKLRQRGIAEYILEQLIHPDDRLSRLVITKDYRIILPDYNDMEIKMEPLVKAVYLLFLKHPEGLYFKHLPDYRKELTSIYNKLKPFGLTDRALQSIEDVTNPQLNSINEKCARIRGAFVGQFDNYMAKHYYIDGTRGEVKKISLPRNLVIWE